MKGITADLLLTAGPRKQGDEGVGEDAAGVALFAKRCLFWICDGTSDCTSLVDRAARTTFSARRLAQDLGLSFRAVAMERIRTRKRKWDLRTLAVALHDSIASSWSTDLMRCDQRNWDGQFDRLTPGQEFLDMSSTFLAGEVNGKGLANLFLCGDSTFAAFQRDAPARFHPGNRGRVFARLRRDRSVEIIGLEALDWISIRNVCTLVAGSDGVGRSMMEGLTQRRGISYEAIRGAFLALAPLTEDDKTLCVISVNEGCN